MCTHLGIVWLTAIALGVQQARRRRSSSRAASAPSSSTEEPPVSLQDGQPSFQVCGSKCCSGSSHMLASAPSRSMSCKAQQPAVRLCLDKAHAGIFTRHLAELALGGSHMSAASRSGQLNRACLGQAAGSSLKQHMACGAVCMQCYGGELDSCSCEGRSCSMT